MCPCKPQPLGLGCGGGGCSGGSSDPFRLVDDVPEAAAYYAVWSFAPNDVWVAANGGQMLHYDGASWSTVELGQAATMVDIWGFAPDDIVAVGGNTLARYDGSSWQLEDLSGAGVSSASAVWGASRDDLWVGGDQSTAAHWDGGVWTRFTIAGTDNHALWGSGPDDVWVASVFDVGHWDGIEWQLEEQLDWGGEAIFGFGPDDVWVADDSELWHLSGGTWTLTEPDGLAGATTLWGPAPDDLWGAGDFGAIVHYDGDGWTTVQSQGIGSPFLRSFADIHGSSATDIWAVGSELGEGGSAAIVYRHR